MHNLYITKQVMILKKIYIYIYDLLGLEHTACSSCLNVIMFTLAML